MKRVFSLLALIFGLSVLVLSMWRSRPSLATVALEREEIQEATQTIGMEEVTPSSAEESEGVEEYSLPYPGMLPDHPLYFLKMIRDRIQLWITRDSFKRAELMLHYADKRIASALVLAEKGKSGLALSTATKAEKYLGQAEEAAARAKESGEDVDDFYDELFRASIQHKRVLMGIETRLPEETKQPLKEAELTSDKIMEKAASFEGISGKLEERVEGTPSSELEEDSSKAGNETEAGVMESVDE